MSNNCLHLYMRPLECLDHGVKCEEAVCVDCGASAVIQQEVAQAKKPNETDNHYCVEIETTTRHTIYIYAPDSEVAQLNACRAVVNSFTSEQAPYGKIWSHQTESNFIPNNIVSSVREIQG